MKSGNLFWGLLLITIGTLFILKNLNIIHFAWYALWQLWPVILILWGVSILPLRGFIRLSLMVLTILISMVFFFDGSQYRTWDFDFRFKRDRDHNYGQHDYDRESQYMHVPYDSIIRAGVLRFDAVAGSFTLNGKTDRLLEFESDGLPGPYRMKVTGDDHEKVIDISLTKGVIGDKLKQNYSEIMLNKQPAWEIQLDAGAAELDIDLADLIISKMSIDGGAADIDVIFGNLSETTNVEIEAAAASVKIRVPKSAGCEVEVSSVLSSRNIEDFEKIKSGLYRTEGFQNAANKIFIDIDSAISKLRIERY